MYLFFQILKIFVQVKVTLEIYLLEVIIYNGVCSKYAESMDKDDFSITIEKYDKEFSFSPLKSDSFSNVTIKGKFGEFTDSFHDEVGAMELIKIGKTHQLVKCKYKDTDSSKISECVKYLEEFNKINNLTQENIGK